MGGWYPLNRKKSAKTFLKASLAMNKNLKFKRKASIAPSGKCFQKSIAQKTISANCLHGDIRALPFVPQGPKLLKSSNTALLVNRRRD